MPLRIGSRRCMGMEFLWLCFLYFVSCLNYHCFQLFDFVDFLLFSVALHLPSTYHDVLCTHGVQSGECCLTRECLKVPRDCTYRVNHSLQYLILISRLSKLPMLWIYFPFLASLAVFV